ncbi:MAG TPA: PDZ domain-containing protein, partial [Kofleriaceae bacterium]|nr:PDZ domain-containing protein [Kofleriaceae bacterium]
IYNSPDNEVYSDAAGHFTVEGSAGEVLVVCRSNDHSGMKFATIPRDKTTELVVSVVQEGDTGSIDAQFFMGGLFRRFAMLVPNGAAAKAGLQIGDEVIAVDGTPVTDLDGRSTMRVITQRPAGATATLTVLRGGATRTVTVTVHAAD